MAECTVRTRIGQWMHAYGRAPILADVFVDYYTKPDETNTGLAPLGLTRAGLEDAATASLPAGVTYSSGDLIVTGPCTLEGLSVPGIIDVRTAGLVTIRGCWVRGNGVTSSKGLIHCTNAAVDNVVVEFCDLEPETPAVRINGIQGHHYRLYRCWVSKVSDDARVQGNGVVIECNYLDRLAFFDPDPDQTDGTHSDNIQVEGGNPVIRGNYIRAWLHPDVGQFALNPYDDRALSGLMLTENTAVPIEGLVVEFNWFDGGFIQVNAGSSSLTGNDLGVFRNNRHYANSSAGTTPPYTYGFDSSVTVYCPGLEGGSQVGDPADNNVWADDDTSGLVTPGAPVTVRRNA